MNEYNEKNNDKQTLNEDNLNNKASEINSDEIIKHFSSFEDNFYQNINNENVQHQNGRVSRVLLVIFTALILAAVAASAIYCIISDISYINSSNLNAFDNGKPEVILNTVHRPVSEDIMADENGKYTVEGLAHVIRPQVVEIYTYSDKNSDVIIGSGSGIIISENGYIVTNTHVLDGMEKYVVNTYDGKSYEAEIAGRDAKTDIAVIKIDANGLSAAEFGNSDDVIQGESVVAIGNPAGLTGSITDGIVSGLNRKIKADAIGYEMDCIQTNAAISPGNSGGALVNMYGQVIGITSSKYATTTTEGLGFAITINEAKPIIEELISQGYVSGRVRIGITFYSSYANYAAVQFKDKFKFEMPKELENALWISEISPDCDISNTELKANDFIISVDGITVNDYSALSDAIKGKKGGDTVKAKCARVSKDKKIEYFEIEFKLMADTSGDF